MGNLSSSTAVSRLKRFTILILLTSICSISSSCYRVGPRTAPPEVELPDEWEWVEEDEHCPEKDSPENEETSAWWTVFQDPQLDRLIVLALKNSPDVNIAYQRILEYRSLFFESNASNYPSVYMNAGHADVELPQGGILFQQPTLANFFKSQNVTLQRKFDFYYLGPILSWEIDVFGRIESENRARTAEYYAANENFAAVQISLSAEVARNYTQLRSAQNQLTAEEGYLESLCSRFSVVQGRLALNKSTLDTLSDVQTKIHESHRTIFQLQKLLEKFKFRLLALIGESSWPFDETFLCYGSIPHAYAEVDAGIPSDLLHQRPDIRQAEGELAAATFRVGRVMAEALPNFQLTGTIGGVSKALADILSYNSLVWLVNPFLTFPVFDGGRNASTVAVYKARAESAFSHYHKTLLNAVEEVQVALYGFDSEKKRFEEMMRIQSLAEAELERKRLLYQNGMTDYSVYSQAQDDFHARELQFFQGQEDVALNYITLTKALGGKLQ